MKILVTGAAGYIGSHTIVELLNNNYEVIGIDNFVNSKKEVVGKIEKVSGKKFKFIEGDVRDLEILNKILNENDIEAVIHFAGLKAVGESVSMPIEYYDNNINSTLSLIKVMKNYRCRKFIFSSSATVYGAPNKLPILENFPLSTTNPYGTTKLVNEYILSDLYKSDNNWEITLLRYFNPIGSEKTGTLGENPNGIPNNLMPYIVRVAIGQLEKLYVYGNDYPTHDGTGVRDYIHVVDLARGHVKAIEKSKKGINIYNLGTGTGYSVLDVVKTFEKVNNVKIPYVITERRPGDVAECYADVSKAKREIEWEAKYNLEDMCKDSYNYIVKNIKK